MNFRLACISFLAATEAAAFVPSSPSRTKVVGQGTFIGPQPVTHANAAEALGFWGRFKKSTETESDTTKDEIRTLFTLWNDALATGDSRIVASRYASDAVLLPTVSDTPRTDYDSIKDYFDNFLVRKPRGVITEQHIKVGRGWAKDAGTYEFTMGDDGSKVKARYSFMYIKENDQWKILHHHSSVMPEGITIAQPVTEKEVKDLFKVWNDALATGDPKKVADCYAKKSVLLPTISDIPRNDYEGIKDYFVNFLKLKPQGEILESDVYVGTNWAQDAGIYEFTMGTDGSKVKGRYSFIYVYEDGQWKISHHHSSVMPEGIISKTQPITKEEVRSLFARWNNALATGDSSKVAKLYGKKSILLPTVSDTPRTNYDSIKNYFDAFLMRKPQGVITSGDITIGANWAQDAGVYEFAMGDDGSTVRARYSFVYVFEDGEWMISHHHSSVMPEGLSGASKKKELIAMN
jgi:uncharacterized protein (TIGR02246 family)